MLVKGDINHFGGVELAMFRLKEGISEDTLIALSQRVEKGFLQHQEELIGHCLLRGPDGIYADVAFATSQQKAEEYCQQWLQEPEALAYLDLIEEGSVNMTFWTRIN